MNQRGRIASELKPELDIEPAVEQVVGRAIGQLVIGKLDVIAGQVLPDQGDLRAHAIQSEAFCQTSVEALVVRQIALSDRIEGG